VLDEAGAALARLARIVVTRFGAMPVAVAGRAAGLHPRLWSALERALPAGGSVQRFEADFAAAAASRAASGPLPLLP
jgi:glucosamine kinase